MRHNVSGRKLGRTPAHRKMLYRNLVTELFRHERITTTLPKAKEARRVAEKLITKAKAGDLHSRREAAKKLNDPAVLQKLFAEIGPRYAERPGGYTRILKLSGGRKGDNAEEAILELVDSSVRPKVTDSLKRKRQRRIMKIEERAEAKAALAEAAAEADAAAEVAEKADEAVEADAAAETDAADEADKATESGPAAEPGDETETDKP
jgi:large subunit ribosomal protein L17